MQYAVKPYRTASLSYHVLPVKPYRAAHPLRLSQAAAAEPVAGGKPVNIVQNLFPATSSTAERSRALQLYDTDDVGDRAGCLDVDEQSAAGAARSALALLAPPCVGARFGTCFACLP
eukprot:6028856-Prymnesium_polylepis.1